MRVYQRLLSRSSRSSISAPKPSSQFLVENRLQNSQLRATIFQTLRKRPYLSAALSLGLAGGAIATYTSTNPKLNMSSKLIPSNPSDVMVIRNLSPSIVTFSVPFLRFGQVRIGGRGTIIRLTSGSLAVFSPVALTPEVKAKVAELGGQVKYIIAPDIEHHIFLSEWKSEYPEAKLIGPAGLPEKRQKQNDPKIGKEPFAVVFDAKTKREQKVDSEFDADFEYEFVDAHPNKELVFFFKPAKTLIQADLMFNLPATEQYSKVPESEKSGGLLNRIFGSLQTTQGDPKNTRRAMWYLFSAGNRPSFNESIQRIDQWDFTTNIPCHGDVMEGNGKELFRKIFEWHLQGHK